MPCGMNSTVRLFADDTIAYLALTLKNRRTQSTIGSEQTWNMGEKMENGIPYR